MLESPAPADSAPITVRVGGVTYLLTPDGSVAADLRKGSSYERHELEFMLECAAPGTVFLDVGSNVGLFALALAKHHAASQVYALEPSSWAFRMLGANVKLNGLANVVLARSAVGDHDGEAVLQVNAAGKDGLNTIANVPHRYCEIVVHEQVPLTTLDTFVVTRRLARVDLLKVDVEGAELLVVRGGESLLRRDDAPLILYESLRFNTGCFGYEPPEVARLLEAFGYQVFRFDSKSGGLARLQSGCDYEGMNVGVKPGHRHYATVERRCAGAAC